MTPYIRGPEEVILGPMFSGKTTELIRRLKRYKIAKYKCLIVRYAKDDRYSKTGIATHDRQELAAVSASDLASVKSMADKADVIGIDEGQFFPDCVNFSENMANSGKIIIVAALDGTFQRVGFGNILQLIPLAESIVKLKAVCMACFKDAAFTKRTTSQKELEVIGGEDMYMAVCRNCHHSPTTKTPSKFPLKECSNTPKIKSLSPSPKKQCTSSENRPVQVKRDLSVSLAMDLA